MQNKIHRSTN